MINEFPRAPALGGYAVDPTKRASNAPNNVTLSLDRRERHWQSL
jgi:hypothetical protein